jgi:hypothetical protein
MEIRQSPGSDRKITTDRHEYWRNKAQMLLITESWIGSIPCR